ncbi:MAG TPA: ARMT1-like domain-containing protein, partial [Spirochaetota bacterium]|nr:ARMT1-like domain-containing protein [Spirochaetota bacterium]
KGFRRAVEEADKILYLMDNAGEIVFDKLLLEQLPLTKITAAVRGAPVINDAVMSDAEEVGICDMVNVIDNGSDAPGTVLEECSSAFTEYFNNADLIIAKGQGNYESLSDTDVNIIFLFQVKCNLVAEQTGLPTGTHVMLNTGV